MKVFGINDIAYTMNNNRIVKGIIKGILKFDELNVKYYFETARDGRWVVDYVLFATIDELIDDLKGCIVV